MLYSYNEWPGNLVMHFFAPCPGQHLLWEDGTRSGGLGCLASLGQSILGGLSLNGAALGENLDLDGVDWGRSSGG